MPYYIFLWDDEVEEHIAQHGVTIEEFEAIVSNPDETAPSRSSPYPVAFGWTEDGRYLCCPYELIDDLHVRPITAFEVGAD